MTQTRILNGSLCEIATYDGWMRLYLNGSFYPPEDKNGMQKRVEKLQHNRYQTEIYADGSIDCTACRLVPADISEDDLEQNQAAIPLL